MTVTGKWNVCCGFGSATHTEWVAEPESFLNDLFFFYLVQILYCIQILSNTGTDSLLDYLSKIGYLVCFSYFSVPVSPNLPPVTTINDILLETTTGALAIRLRPEASVKQFCLNLTNSWDLDYKTKCCANIRLTIPISSIWFFFDKRNRRCYR
jgi:hypothetical protein